MHYKSMRHSRGRRTDQCESRAGQFFNGQHATSQRLDSCKVTLAQTGDQLPLPCDAAWHQSWALLQSSLPNTSSG
eukprot:6998159-Lingulodinium_polyedra.AAC.1